MTARILVVDDIPANVKLLEARLLAEYFEVATAMNGADALDICEKSKIDVVLLDIMMPGMDGFEVCRRLKADPATAQIPVVMVTALDQVADRVRGLQAGADDFLTKPVNDLQLMTRVKSLVRLKTLTDELRLRAATTKAIGLEELAARQTGLEDRARVLVVDDRASSAERILRMLREHADVTIVADPAQAMFRALEKPYDCALIASRLDGHDPLRVCAHLRALDRTRFLPIMLVSEQGDDDLVMRALDLGVNDYLVRPLEQQELLARLMTQVRRKRYNDQLRASISESVEMAVTDVLTGLHNRRYLETHLETLVDRAANRKRPLSLLIADIDRFKSVNDTFGHAAGDDVLREFAKRLRVNVRGIDLACRFGGEEFVVIMPDTDAQIAASVAERLREEIAGKPFTVSGAPVVVTASVGVATLLPEHDSAAALMKRADAALYEAKGNGRNKVVSRAA